MFEKKNRGKKLEDLRHKLENKIKSERLPRTGLVHKHFGERYFEKLRFKMCSWLIQTLFLLLGLRWYIGR